MNYIRECVFEIKLTKSEAEWWKKLLKITDPQPWDDEDGWKVDEGSLDAKVMKIVDELNEIDDSWKSVGWEFSAQLWENEVRVSCNQDSRIDFVARICQLFLKEVRPKGRVGLTWGWIERGGGGGAMFITARKIRTFNTDDWLDHQIARHKW